MDDLFVVVIVVGQGEVLVWLWYNELSRSAEGAPCVIAFVFIFFSYLDWVPGVAEDTLSHICVLFGGDHIGIGTEVGDWVVDLVSTILGWMLVLSATS